MVGMAAGLATLPIPLPFSPRRTWSSMKSSGVFSVGHAGGHELPCSPGRPSLTGYIRDPKLAKSGSSGLIRNPKLSESGSHGLTRNPKLSKSGSAGVTLNPKLSKSGSPGLSRNPKLSKSGSPGLSRNPKLSKSGSHGLTRNPKLSKSGSAGLTRNPKLSKSGSPDHTGNPKLSKSGCSGLNLNSQDATQMPFSCGMERNGDIAVSGMALGGVALGLLLGCAVLQFPEVSLAATESSFPTVITFAGAEPSNALSLPTWVIHVASVVEWVTAMALVWRYGDMEGKSAWKGLTWGMVPLLGGAMCACTWHFFYNAESLEVLVVLQAFLTVVGNCTMWAAAYRIWKVSQEKVTID